ncbi:chemotaxis protein CheW [Candidatus Methylomirabilis sp.]|uniref:chemotaxis protein CheW n=1 Tax=Candidatus Methylomirabilis sp. TaxID=2032687 RepID=UPI003C77BBAA
MNETRQAVNYEEVYSRLEETRRALEAGGSLPPEEVKRILRDRAHALAKPLAEVRTPAEVLELLVFSLAGGRYGIEMSHVLEVIPLRELTPMPCTPPFVLGVVNHRGRILPVLDFRRLLDLADQGIAEGSKVIAVDTGGMSFGIYADAMSGVERIGANEMAPPPAAVAGDRHTFLLGVTGEMVAVLDLERIAFDKKIVVHEQVEV